MATKKFKKLPKDSQRAAFAQMDDDGTRQGKGGKSGGGVPVKTLKASGKKLKHIKTPEQRALLEKSVVHFEKGTKDDQARMKRGLLEGESGAKRDLRSNRGATGFYGIGTTKKSKEFLSTARAFRLRGTTKKGK